MATPRIVLAGASPALDGLSWETETALRIGRQGNMDILLSDSSVGRLHAEVGRRGLGWVVRDLVNSDTTPSYLNGVQLRGQSAKLSLHDVLQFGRLKLKVTVLSFGSNACDSALTTSIDDNKTPWIPACADTIKTSWSLVRVEKSAQLQWDESLQIIVTDPTQVQRQSEHLLALLRTSRHLRHISSLDELLTAILDDVIRALDAQRGAIILLDQHYALELRALRAPSLPAHAVGLGYSRTLADKCISQGESLLCQDVKLESSLRDAKSVRRGAMMSIICAVLRSPYHRLGVLHLDRGPFQEPFTPADLYLADAIAATAAMSIECAYMVERQQHEFIASVTSLAQTVEQRDPYRSRHTRRVTDYAVLLARELGLAPAEIDRIRIGAPLLDIGKIAVDDAILRKPGRLTADEFEMMKTHTITGASILQSMSGLNPMVSIVRHHHERWDGRGYPDGLASEDIPQIARIVAVADAFDAMTSDRPYRAALPAEIAFAEILKNAGSHFDPECVEVFLKLRPQIENRLLRGRHAHITLAKNGP